MSFSAPALQRMFLLLIPKYDDVITRTFTIEDPNDVSTADPTPVDLAPVCSDPSSSRDSQEPFFLVPVDLSLPDDRETIVVNDSFLNAHHSSAAEQRDATLRQGGAKTKTSSFSKPKPGNFSYRRRKPDISALRHILSSLND